MKTFLAAPLILTGILFLAGCDPNYSRDTVYHIAPSATIGEAEAQPIVSEEETATLNTNGKPDVSRIYGKIQYVDSFPDYKVQVVSSFPDLKVQHVSSFPDKPGKWQIVDSFPDYKIQKVSSFPDFKIQYVDSFPGVP